MNKKNLELKHYCSDFKSIRRILKELGAKKEITKKQKDYFFKLPAKSIGRLKLRVENSKKTLIYYERPNFKKAKSTTSDIKLYSAKDGGLLPLLQHALGTMATVEKIREVWRKDNTVFHIDRVNGVGGIFEIELQKNGKILEKDRKLFAYYQSKLLPFLGDIIKGSNIDLIQKKQNFENRQERSTKKDVT